MTDAQQRILNVLEGQADPLTSHELAELSGFTQTEVLKALSELQNTHEIYKGPLGYKLLKLEKATDDLAAVLKLLAGEAKTRLPKTIRDLLNWPDERLKPVLRFGKNSHLLSMSDQGYYYLTMKGVELLKVSCPGFDIKPFVLDKIKNPPERFHINADSRLSAKQKGNLEAAERTANNNTTHPAVLETKQIASLLAVQAPLPALKQPDIKLSILRELIKVFSPEAKSAATELMELVTFIEEYRKHECPA